MAIVERRLPLPSARTGRDGLGGAFLALAIGLVAIADGGVTDLLEPGFLGALIACGALAGRRLRPVVVLAFTSIVFVSTTVLSGSTSLAFIPLIVAAYTAVAYASSVAASVTIALASVLVTTLTVAAGVGDVDVALTASAAAWMAVVGAVGVAMLMYRRSVAKERERALRAEEARDAVAKQKVAEERLRIARELHDAVGHHVAVITVQAGVAEHLLSVNPDKAAEALAQVQEAGAKVLEELPVMLRVLRQDDDQPTAPAAGLSMLADLLSSARAGGLYLEVTGSIDGIELASAADLTAYRVIQEALTNARKHGDGTAALRISREGTDVRIEVSNPVGPMAGDAPESGFGLLGMRERVDAAGGSLAVGREGGRYVLRVALPLRHHVQEVQA